MKSPAGSLPVRIMLVAEPTLFRESLVRLIEREPGFRIAAQSGTAAEVMAALRTTPADVVVVDLQLAEDFFIPSVRGLAPNAKILVISDGADATRCLSSLQAGALGIILKEDSPEMFLRAIRLIASGSAWLDRKMIRRLAERTPPKLNNPPRFVLNPLEQQVLQGVSEGLTNSDIAQRAGISNGAVKAVLRRLFHRTGARTRSQLVRRAILEPGVEPGGAHPDL